MSVIKKNKDTKLSGCFLLYYKTLLEKYRAFYILKHYSTADGLLSL